jgi:hypothetical protein
MHDLATRLMNEIASARAAIAASYLQLRHELDRSPPTASGRSPRDHGEAPGDAPADADPDGSPQARGEVAYLLIPSPRLAAVSLAPPPSPAANN